MFLLGGLKIWVCSWLTIKLIKLSKTPPGFSGGPKRGATHQCLLKIRLFFFGGNRPQVKPFSFGGKNTQSPKISFAGPPNLCAPAGFFFFTDDVFWGRLIAKIDRPTLRSGFLQRKGGRTLPNEKRPFWGGKNVGVKNLFSRRGQGPRPKTQHGPISFRG